MRRKDVAYPITPATELLEWMSPALKQIGGVLVQAEDELASINQAIGASYGGVPALTATSGPGLSLMVESLGLAVEDVAAAHHLYQKLSKQGQGTWVEMGALKTD